MFRRGLVVTAVCTSCHTAHFVLPHTDPRSSISKRNIAKTCEQCHAQIEVVHRKVIRGELWEKQPHLIPACIDCHEPHKIRRVFYPQGMADRDCLRCHERPDIMPASGIRKASLFVKESELAQVPPRARCLRAVSHGWQPLARAAVCHDDRESGLFGLPRQSGRAVQREHSRATGGAGQPRRSHLRAVSRHARRAGPSGYALADVLAQRADALRQCHRTGQKAALRYTGTQINIVERYTESIHGKGLLQSGLTVTANCADCHTPHHELPSKDPRSSVNPKNVAATCGRCHQGIFELFEASIHAPQVAQTDKPLPVCSSCHSAHSIRRTDLTDFRLHIMDQCGVATRPSPPATSTPITARSPSWAT